MKTPDYYAPSTLDKALDKLMDAGDRVKIIAGGTDLLVALRHGLERPKLLIDLSRIPLANIEVGKSAVTFGARVTHTQLLKSEVVARHFPALSQASREIGGPPIRNRGTLGGNLANASPAADTGPPLLVHKAAVHLAKSGGDRVVPLDKFFVGPGQTVLAPGEILTTVQVPIPPPNSTSVFLRLGKRQAMAIAIASVAVLLALGEENQVEQVRIALGSVVPSPIRAYPVETLLTGKLLTEQSIEQAAREAATYAQPITDLRASAAYRKRMVQVLTSRALRAARHTLQEGSADG